MNCRHSQLALVASAASLLAACTTMGTGTGQTRGGGPSVSFSWTAEDAVKGQMTARLDSGETYSGPLFQITSETRVDDLEPLWVGWRGRFGWANWDSGPQFMTTYSGRVLANLSNAEGDHMRCNFRLVRPRSGLAGGGQGKCQLSSGRAIDATFPAA